MKRNSAHRWGMTELAWPIFVVVVITIVGFILLSRREMYLRRKQADNVTIHTNLYRARVMFSRGYMTYLLHSAGDNTVRHEQLTSYLDQALSGIDDALSVRGGWHTAGHARNISPAQKEVIEGIRRQIVAFNQQLHQSFAANVGPDLDQRNQYMLILQQIVRQNDLLQAEIIETYSQQDSAVRISIGIWAGSMAGILLLLVVSSIRRGKTQHALMESEKRFRATFNQAAVGIAHVAPDGAWLMVNDRLCNMLGYTEDELRNLRFQDITYPEDLERDVGMMEKLMAGEVETYSIEKRYICKDKSITWANLTVSLVRDRDGKPHYFISVVENINERKRIQADRDELLERERHARADAESASRAKDHFLAVVSHELRTPLTPVTTGLDLLSRSRAVMAEHGETLAMMRRNIEAESQIISDLLDVARLSNNKIEIHSSVIDLHSLLRETEQTFRIGMQNKAIQWNFDLRATESLVQADSLRMTQVFTNLLNNAIKFSPDGGNISISTSNPVTGTIRIEVRDVGIGIDPDVIQRLFRPFEQAEVSLARRYGGLGLGLSIARSLVELHGGSLRAQSKGLGMGASFIVELPLTTEPVSVRENVVGHSSHPEKNILVVEDNSDTAQALMRLLKSLGHSVTLATSGAEGLALAARGGYDILLSDIGLPDFSGWELIRRLKQTSDLPAIALSGFGTEDDLRRSREAGFVAHLVKPIDIIRLENVINGIARQSAKPG